MELLILIFIIIAIVKFFWTWIKVKIFLVSMRSDKNSFLVTISYLLFKNELSSFID